MRPLLNCCIVTQLTNAIGRGAVQQRHKKEWKTARSSIETMKKERLKLNKTDLDEKAERKGISREANNTFSLRLPSALSLLPCCRLRQPWSG